MTLFLFATVSSFSGFAEDENEVHETRTKKLKDSKKWTVTALKNLCSLLGLDKGGSKVMTSMLILFDFLMYCILYA